MCIAPHIYHSLKIKLPALRGIRRFEKTKGNSMTYVTYETIYLILIGTLSTVTGWLIISAIQQIYQVTKQFIRDLNHIKKFSNDLTQMKSDIEELKAIVKTLDDKIGDKE